MVRRQQGPRSNKGCITCKERHVRCDERIPFCRNCVRLGRECRYTTAAGSGPTRCQPRAPVVSASTKQAVMAMILPQTFTFYYCDPKLRGTSSTAISIVQQAGEISMARPMARSILLTAAHIGGPKFNFLAAKFPCAQHALISFAAYTHFHATYSEVSKDVCIKHTCFALKELQKEVNSFGPLNADAVITASIALGGTADNWEQWAIFVDGFTNSLSQIRKNKMPTLYEDLLGDRFPLRLLSEKADTYSRPLIKDHDSMRSLVKEVIKCIADATSVLGLQKWRATGFEALKRLAQVTEDALSVASEIEQYHQLACLRSWMFWVDLRRNNGEEEERLLAALFYALVFAIVPLFPARFSTPLIEICLKRIKVGWEGMVFERAKSFGLLRLQAAFDIII